MVTDKIKGEAMRTVAAATALVILLISFRLLPVL
jgi:hypothetical protein